MTDVYRTISSKYFICVSEFIVVEGQIGAPFLLNYFNNFLVPVPVAARSKVQVCCRSPAEIVGSNPTGGMDVCLL